MDPMSWRGLKVLLSTSEAINWISTLMCTPALKITMNTSNLSMTKDSFTSRILRSLEMKIGEGCFANGSITSTKRLIYYTKGLPMASLLKLFIRNAMTKVRPSLSYKPMTTTPLVDSLLNLGPIKANNPTIFKIQKPLFFLSLKVQSTLWSTKKTKKRMENSQLAMPWTLYQNLENNKMVFKLVLIASKQHLVLPRWENLINFLMG